MNQKDPKSKLSKTECMLWDIFRLCDKTVWCEDWLEFQEGFEKILKGHGHSLWKIYFGVPSKGAWRKKCLKAWKKTCLDFEKKKKARKPDVGHYHIKNRKYKVKL